MLETRELLGKKKVEGREACEREIGEEIEMSVDESPIYLLQMIVILLT